jgi:methylated-DNA-protein-cysteine methyltransferase related protein
MNLNDKYYREKVYEIVRLIPSGRVMTYGQIAQMLSKNYTARTVGFVMHAAETENVPWQRVINSRGSCSTEKILLPYNVQQKYLKKKELYSAKKVFAI